MDEYLIATIVFLVIVLAIFMWQVVKGNKASTSKYTGYMHNLTEDHQYERNPSMYPVPVGNTHREKFGFDVIVDNDKLNTAYSGY